MTRRVHAFRCPLEADFGRGPLVGPTQAPDPMDHSKICSGGLMTVRVARLVAQSGLTLLTPPVHPLLGALPG